MSSTPHKINHAPSEETSGSAVYLKLDQLATDEQVRKVFNEEKLRVLAASLQSEGQLQPILVYRDDARGNYVVLAGERRLRAARMIEMPGLDCIVYPRRLTPSEIRIVQITENTLREGLDPIEHALGYQAIIEQDGISQNQLAERLHIHATTIGRAMALLELPEDLQAEIRGGDLVPGIARELARMSDEGERRSVLAKVRAEELTASKTSKLVTKLLNEKQKKPRRKPKPAKTTYRLEGKHEAVITKKGLRLTPPAGKKEWTPGEQVNALRSLAQKIEEDAGKATASA